MTWHEKLQDFGEEIEPGGTFRFECHRGLKCFGACCATDITLTPFDIARMRRHMGVDTHQFLSLYCESFVDSITGFPSVLLKHGKDDRCVFLRGHGCHVYKSRPSCCRNYPLARVIENNVQRDAKLVRHFLQRRADYCEGLGKGPEWTIETFSEENGLGPYERANDVFVQIPFAFEMLPIGLRHDKEVQSMIYQAVFDFDRFFEKYGPFGPYGPPQDDHEMIALLTSISLGLIRRTGALQSKG
jgi:Fe-S-cluster containining protein